MKIILINLMRASDRRHEMNARFTAAGLRFDLLQAIDGRDLTAADRAQVDHHTRRRFTAYPLTDNEIGCWLSHRQAMQRLIASTDAMAAIVEDDALLSDDFAQVLAAIEAGGFEFDIVFLHRNFKRREVFCPCRPLTGRFVLGRVGYSSMKATAYVISRAGASKFMEQGPPFIHAVDMAMHRYWDNGLDIYGLNHPVAQEDPAACSYIEETRLQCAPHLRVAYADAGTWRLKLRRRLTRLEDSIRKRLAFAAYGRFGHRHPTRRA